VGSEDHIVDLSGDWWRSCIWGMAGVVLSGLGRSEDDAGGRVTLKLVSTSPSGSVRSVCRFTSHRITLLGSSGPRRSFGSRL
jgi:hypothetical protein